ncbi:MAG: DNA-processing protein DprA, partial [Oscillospiraceae bacterium]|nr:DNA-processing protein DprA [Oscillospiraceae bacterium]
MLREINSTSVMIWLSLLGKPNYLIYSLLMKEYGCAEGIYNAFLTGRKPESLRAYEKALTAFSDKSLAVQAADICNKAAERGMKTVTLNDSNYPYKLRNLPSACPLVLYYYGEISEEDFSEDGISVAVVGSRHCSVSGEANSESFSYELSKRGVNIVSGLARGCDGAAHN